MHICQAMPINTNSEGPLERECSKMFPASVNETQFRVSRFLTVMLREMIFSRTHPAGWLWAVPSPGERRKSLYHLWNHPVHGWEKHPPLASAANPATLQLLELASIFHSIIREGEFMNSKIMWGVSVLCSSRGAEWWTLQPCSWLVVAGNSAFLIGYWEGELLLPAGRTVFRMISRSVNRSVTDEHKCVEIHVKSSCFVMLMY